ncbi:hypothetical protein M406DRAFT_261591 [Cryphonectria parasitica EP155]|uniref:Inosine/uridine-preferring nucleoside hydrolase domain-containing protein n=1 Tax=Cryphonectria parasitica (strain ATCC 38755 / EP155) TaxID=660469 RepID=A0A9P4XYX5_CRYP1|nr:uncharacterized protein M406DRAFT_261591 [Cryphonectria parasitica EP155]KAF3763466.1 hypothetical protein M406DRAFT_261591 [Cryphonectria parasitica EP155]
MSSTNLLNSDAGALLLAATSPDAELLAVNLNYPSSFSAVAASAILAHYGLESLPIGIPRPLNNNTFFDSWYYELGEYASKVARHWSAGSLPWGRADEAWDPVSLYRKILSEADDGSITIASIGFLDNLSGLLNTTSDSYSYLSGPELIRQKVSELVVMGGAYPSGHSWNFYGSNASLTRHAINSWEGKIIFIGDDVSKYILTGGPLMDKGPANDPVRMAYIYYSYFNPRSSWDPLAVLYAIHGLTDMFEYGNKNGYNYIEPNGTNRWVWDKSRDRQHFLRLKSSNETAAAKVDKLFLQGASSAAHRPPTKPLSPHRKLCNCFVPSLFENAVMLAYDWVKWAGEAPTTIL